MTSKMVVTGLEKVQSHFAVAKKDVLPMLESVTRDAVIFVHSNMPAYPPARPNSWYVRTMTLWRSITTFSGVNPGALSRIEPLVNAVKGWVGSSVEYAPRVIGEGQQEEPWVEYWWTLEKVIRDLKPQIKKVYQDGVHDWVKNHFD